VKQPVRAYGPRQRAALRESFAGHGFSIKKLVTEIATTASLIERQDPPPPRQTPMKPANPPDG
jgi:hypothetical protein